MSNTIVWTDIPVNDLKRAAKFYAAVLGEKVTMQSHGDWKMALLPHAKDNVSGCLSQMEDNQPSQTGPLIYLNVNGRLKKAVAAAKKHKGKIVQEPHQIGPYGFRAVILDSEGNRVALHSP